MAKMVPLMQGHYAISSNVLDQDYCRIVLLFPVTVAFTTLRAQKGILSNITLRTDSSVLIV